MASLSKINFEMREGVTTAVSPKFSIAFYFIFFLFLILHNTYIPHFIGRQIPISPSVDRLFPAIEMFNALSLEANFGDDSAKPFKFDVNNFPGL
jgi:hypothetical protein